jgi:hypothetical protein
MTRALRLAMICAALAPVPAHPSGPAAEAPSGDKHAPFATHAVPSYHAFPPEILALMRRRILAQRGILPEPVSEPEPEPAPAHGSGH